MLCYNIILQYILKCIIVQNLGLDSMTDDMILVLVSRPFYQGLGLETKVLVLSFFKGLDNKSAIDFAIVYKVFDILVNNNIFSLLINRHSRRMIYKSNMHR